MLAPELLIPHRARYEIPEPERETIESTRQPGPKPPRRKCCARCPAREVFTNLERRDPSSALEV